MEKKERKKINDKLQLYQRQRRACSHPVPSSQSRPPMDLLIRSAGERKVPAGRRRPPRRANITICFLQKPIKDVRKRDLHLRRGTGTTERGRRQGGTSAARTACACDRLSLFCCCCVQGPHRKIGVLVFYRIPQIQKTSPTEMCSTYHTQSQ